MMSIFGTDLTEVTAEWMEEGLEPSYGSVENDLLVQAWEERHDPVPVFKKEGLYEKLKTLVHSQKISGTFYHDVEESEHFEHLAPGDKIDYRSCLTRWAKRLPEGDGTIVLKLTCEGARGLDMKRELILGECQLKVVARSKDLIEVQLIS